VIFTLSDSHQTSKDFEPVIEEVAPAAAVADAVAAPAAS
jgi:hypothetical protein